MSRLFMTEQEIKTLVTLAQKEPRDYALIRLMASTGVFDSTDLHVEVIDMLGNRVACESGLAMLVAMVSALRKTPALPGLVILGDLSIQGNIKPVTTLAEPLQIVMENGARRALIPLENKRAFLEVSGDVVEKVDPVFFSDPLAACHKALNSM